MFYIKLSWSHNLVQNDKNLNWHTSKIKKGTILGCLILDSLMEVTEFGISSNSPVSLKSTISHIAGQKSLCKSCEIFPNKSICLERVITSTWLKKA